MKKLIIFFVALAFFTLKNQAQTVHDTDGNVYDTIHMTHWDTSMVAAKPCHNQV